MGIIFGDAHAFLLLSTQQFDMNRGAEGFCDPSEHAQGMAFVGRRFQSADLLLRSSDGSFVVTVSEVVQLP
jgi:hypothetical protein